MHIEVNGRPAAVPEGVSMAAALVIAGEPLRALCGMGVCFECRVTIDGTPHTRSCQTIVREGMVIET